MGIIHRDDFMANSITGHDGRRMLRSTLRFLPSSECGRPHERALSRRRRTESLGAKCSRERKGMVEHVAVRDKQFFCPLLFVFPLNYRHYVDTGYITNADADYEIY